MVKVAKKRSAPLYGLVLAGGKSTRMKRDKAALKYHGKGQAVAAYELLSQFCEKVFVSAREQQHIKNSFPKIFDKKKFSGIGPSGGILSAMTQYPKVAWLVLACDLPFVNGKTLKHLIRYRNSKKTATAYISRHDGLPEPLCAVYEPSARPIQLKFLKKGISCPRKILINSNLRLLTLKDKRSLDNVNTPKEYKQAVALLSCQGNFGGRVTRRVRTREK